MGTYWGTTTDQVSWIISVNCSKQLPCVMGIINLIS